MTKIFKRIIQSGLLSGLLITASCVKQEFDQPVTANVDPSLAVTKTIAGIKLLAPGAVPVQITTNEIIAGVVIADDESGNFYKEIILQDSTGGIAIDLDMSNFNTTYPIGRRVYVKCRDLYIAKDASGTYRIGVLNGTSIGRIPQALVSSYLVPGMWGQFVSPRTYLLSDVVANPTSIPQHTLIKLMGVEFASADTAKPYANASTLTSQNRKVQNCTGQNINVYSSGYANFASNLTPAGNGSIVAVYVLYNNAGELLIRNTDDVDMTGNRCGSGTGGTLITIAALRAMYSGATLTIPSGNEIEGTVISDKDNGNITANNVVIQDATGGMTIRFTSANTFALGTKIRVVVGGQELSEFNSLLQVNNAAISLASQTGTATVTPRIATISDIMTNGEAWESTLVQISGVTITGGGTYNGTTTLTDATGSLPMFTRSSASFASTSYPTATVTVTGIVSDFNGRQLNIRNTSDVQ